MLLPYQLIIGCHCGVMSKEDITEWADKVIASGEDIPPDLYNVYKGNDQDACRAFLGIFEPEMSRFNVESPEGIAGCEQVLGTQLRKLVRKDITPLDFCRFISDIETFFMDHARVENGSLSTPGFLGDLWNACDWCDEHWTLESSPFLYEEAQRVLNALSKSNPASS